MSGFCSAASLPPPTVPKDTVRPLAKFDSSSWGDYFLNYLPEDEVTQAKKEEKAKELGGEVLKKLQHLKARAEKRLELINFIDTIERLGLAYRLEEEIEQALQIVHDWIKESDDHIEELDLFQTSLLFRLLRQHGLYISCDVFGKFQDENGRFKDSLATDVKGMLSLYEASFVGKHEDYVMDEALTFTKGHLKSTANNSISHLLASQVSHALYQSLHKGMTWLEARIFISFYQKDPSHDSTLLKFAKLNFNIVQDLHKKELRHLTRWWKDLGLLAKMPFSNRDRIVEAYFWSLGVYFEPKYALSRKLFIRVFKMISLIDDIYDAYGTYEELLIFTKALERWDISWTSELPEYMELCFNAVLETFVEMERDLAPLGRSQFLKYVREELIDNCQAFMREAKWCHEQYIPKFDEYMNKAAIVSAGCFTLINVSYLNMEEANKESFEWAHRKPLFIRDTSVIGRLMDDIVGHTFEKQRKHVSSAAEGYMIQYGVSEEDARKELQRQVNYCWKNMNEMMMKPYIVPKQLLLRILNMSRAMNFIYGKGEDCYTFPNHLMKQNITEVLTEPFLF